MDFLTIRYQNNGTYKNLFSEFDKKKEEDKFIPEKELIPTDKEKITEIENKIKLAKDKVKSEILKEEITAEPFFDEEFLKHLDVLNNFFANYIPNFPKYYAGGKVNPRAFLDAKSLLENEFPISPEEVINTPTTDNGITKTDKMNFENGYTVDFDGNIYDPNKRLIYNSNFANEKIKFIDLLNNKLVTDKGIRIELPKNFLDDFLVDINEIDNDIKEEIIKLPGETTQSIVNEKKYYNPKTIKENIIKFRENAIKYPKDVTNLLNFENVYSSFHGHPITFEEKYMVELPIENLYMSDIFLDVDKISFVEEIKQFNTTEKELGICNFKDIPYGELTSLLLWGGGEKGVKPLSSSVITDKDIIFAQDGTAKYTNVNSSIRISRNGCKERTYKTGHLCMWTPSNRLGLRRSIIQYIYSFCSGLGLFNANIPSLFGFKKIKVFGGICIGGLLERVLCAWQERMSKRINEMFQCTPAPLSSDLSKSGFENATFPHGASLETLEDLDKLTSIKFGDRYVINLVPTYITGNKTVACGVFIFDPNQKLKDFCPWRYKEVWAGKPFNSKDNFQMVQEFNNVFNNPIIQDVLSNSNALGEDSITRKLLSLQYAFMKKQLLLTATDIESSIETIMENSIYEATQNITQNFGKYQELLDISKGVPDNLTTKEQLSKYRNFQTKFLEYFAPLQQYGYVLPTKEMKSVSTPTKVETGHEWYGKDFEKYRKIYKTVFVNEKVEVWSTEGNMNAVILPKPSLISKYDAVLFALRMAPNNEAKNVFSKNIEYLLKTDPKLAKEYQNVRTMRDYLNITGKFDEFMENLKTTIDFVSYDLNINGYDKEVFEQCMKRINAFIDDVSVIPSL